MEHLQHFAQQLVTLSLREVDLAVAVLWFKQHFESAFEATATELVYLLKELRLTKGQINTGRLSRRLKKHSATVQGSTAGRYRIGIKGQPSLDAKYLPLLTVRNVKVTKSVIDCDQFPEKRKYLRALAHQINGCYEYSFYDGCAVLCRRMTESLLVEVFVQKGHEDKIKKDGQIQQLSSVLGTAVSKQFFHLSRGMDAILEKIKNVGDTAAHHRYHITTKQDIDDLKVDFRKAISELMSLAGI